MSGRVAALLVLRHHSSCYVLVVLRLSNQPTPKFPWDGSATSSKQASKQAGAVNFHAPLQLSLPVGGTRGLFLWPFFFWPYRDVKSPPPRIG